MADRVLHGFSGFPTPPFDFSTLSPWVRERVEAAKIDPAMVTDIVASTDALGKGYIVSVEIGYYPDEPKPFPRRIGRPRNA